MWAKYTFLLSSWATQIHPLKKPISALAAGRFGFYLQKCTTHASLYQVFSSNILPVITSENKPSTCLKKGRQNHSCNHQDQQRSSPQLQLSIQNSLRRERENDERKDIHEQYSCLSSVRRFHANRARKTSPSRLSVPINLRSVFSRRLSTLNMNIIPSSEYDRVVPGRGWPNMQKRGGRASRSKLALFGNDAVRRAALTTSCTTDFYITYH